MEILKSKVCQQIDLERHTRCGGGLVASGQICQCTCHKRNGRPALEGAARQAATRRADRTRPVS